MSNPQNLYAWAAGYDVALNSLTQVTSVIASGDTRAFPAPQCRGTFDAGVRKPRTNSVDFFQGYNSISWIWAALTWNQYAYIYNTILGGAYSGPVTLYTRLGFDAYSRIDGVFHLPEQNETDGKYFAPKKVVCPVTRIKAAA